MRILLLSQTYPPRFGGVETVAHMLAVRLSARGHEVRVVSNRYPRTLPAREILSGIEVERPLFLEPSTKFLWNRRPDLWLGSLYHCPATDIRLQRLMKSYRPEIVNLHFPDAMIPFVLRLRRRHRFRLVVSLHGTEVEQFTVERARAGSLRAILREADAVTACSRYLLDLASAIEPCAASKGTAIYNAIDPGSFDDRTPYLHNRAYIFAWGRLTSRKGFHLLLEAFARIASYYPDIDLLIAGDGELRDSLVALADRLALGKRVSFLGMVSDAELTRLRKGCLFAVVSSTREAFGIVALETLAAGKPLLATRVPGMEEFLEHVLTLVKQESGSPGPPGQLPLVLVKPTVEGLMDGLRACLTAEWSVAGQHAITTTVLREFSWERMVDHYEDALTGQRRATAVSQR
jgi:glycogen synthase